TTSLYNYLILHPKIKPSFKKEVHYFDNNYTKGLNWYKSHFPVKLRNDEQTGEASPYYIFHPLVPKRIYETTKNISGLEEIKFIVLLRDPVERAISHYKHEVRIGAEKLSIREAFRLEQKRLENEERKMITEKDYYSYAHQHFSYLERGKYVVQLKRWFSYFKKRQFYITSSEKLFNNPEITYNEITEFLEIPKYNGLDFQIYNKTENIEVDPDIKFNLKEFFRPYNKELQNFLGLEFPWDY
ncbi:MAG: sulfotransferase domain-containing protein, partial [Candidatus Heimdallarchaeaceae archaeon]